MGLQVSILLGVEGLDGNFQSSNGMTPLSQEINYTGKYNRRGEVMSANPEQTYRSRMIQFVTFILKGEVYGINVMQVQEVLRVSEIAPVPGAPSYVLGIINLRGNVVTVIDTRTRFNLPPTEVDDASRIIVIESEKQVVGMLVDAVAEVVELNEKEIDVAPTVGTEEGSRYIQGLAARKDKLMILVDLNKLLSDKEWADINEH